MEGYNRGPRGLRGPILWDFSVVLDLSNDTDSALCQNGSSLRRILWMGTTADHEDFADPACGILVWYWICPTKRIQRFSKRFSCNENLVDGFNRGPSARSHPAVLL